jgi:hypothetical protein
VGAEGINDFFEFASEFADGERWKILRAEGWDDFEERLAVVVGELPVRRRQALMMLLLALIEDYVTSEDVRSWMDGHDIGDDGGIEELIAWLRLTRAEDAR